MRTIKCLCAFSFICLCGFIFAQFAPAAATLAKNLTLADFEGNWLLDVEKSKSGVKNAVSMLQNYKGFRFAINAKGKTLRMEWPDADPKTRTVTEVKGYATRLECKLDGFTQMMIIEKSGADEILVKDRSETLVFSRVKPEKTE